MNGLIKNIRSFLRNRAGVALIEFAFILPVVIVLLFGGLEVSRYIMIKQKVERAGFALGDMVTQTEQNSFTAPELNNIFQQYFRLMKPYGDAAKQVAVISSVTKASIDGKIYVNWQYFGGGTLNNADTVSIVSNLPANQASLLLIGTEAQFTGDVQTQLSTMLNDENMIVTEVFFRYEPILSGLLSSMSQGKFSIGAHTMVRRTFLHPRKGDLDCPIGTFKVGTVCAPLASSSGPPPGPPCACASATEECLNIPKKDKIAGCVGTCCEAELVNGKCAPRWCSFNGGSGCSMDFFCP